MRPEEIDGLDWERGGGLLPAVVQDASTGEVRMLGWMDRAALAATLESGRATFFSRSRGRQWIKGETSGHRLEVVGVDTDCDRDALLVRARPVGPTCHTGSASCFGAAPTLVALERRIGERLASGGEGSYTARLVREGVARVAQKVGEEGVEVALAGVGDDRGRLVSESADLVYHLLVLLAARGIPLSEVLAELDRRAAPATSGSPWEVPKKEKGSV